MIWFFNGQDSQPIQPLLPHAAPQVGLNQFQFGKESLGCCPVTCNVRNNSRAVHRRWMLRSKLWPVYFPNTIAKVSNSTVKSNTLVVFVCACACVRVLRAHNYFFRGGGGGPSTCPGPGARGFLIRPWAVGGILINRFKNLRKFLSYKHKTNTHSNIEPFTF